MELLVSLYRGNDRTEHKFLLVGGPLDTAEDCAFLFAAYGHMAASWSRLETHIDILIMQINKAQHEPEEINLYDPEHPRPFIDKLQLLKRYFNRHPALSEHTETIREIASELKTTSLERNGYLHSALAAYDGHEKIAKFHSIQPKGNDNFQIQFSDVPIEQFYDLIRRINDLNRRLGVVSETLFSKGALERLGKPSTQNPGS